MPYRKYDPAIKVAAVHLLLDGRTDDEVRSALHEPISSKSLRRWTELFHETHSVIRNPHDYQRRGRPRLYGPADRQFIEELVFTDSTLFLDEIRDQVYDERGVWASVSTLQVELHHRLHLTLKKANVRHCNRSGFARQKFLDELIQYPAEYLVFTGKSFFTFYEFLFNILMYSLDIWSSF
jgi:transposase